MTERHPRNVHVVFVHGVGTHSRLSSLLRAYQALRASLRSPEAPHPFEDPIPAWKLEEFDDGGSAAAPRLKLVADGKPAVFFYEVNYSALAGVVRGNHPLDLTDLFVGFDLAVNVARVALAADPPAEPRPNGRFAVDDQALARAVQRLAGVMVAATVPILGLPSLLLRRFTGTLVATFTRFFEDIATFAIDLNGEALINAHLDRTLRCIVELPSFEQAGEGFDRDTLVIAAHSLGSVVASSYLVRHRAQRALLPDRLFTFGSPIGLVCWLWLFFDFQSMDVDRPKTPRDLRYFAWKATVAPEVMPGRFQWINVINHLDPIASAFAVDCVALKETPARLRESLSEQRIHHRFIDSGGSAGSAHTSYFDDRDGFINLLGRVAGLREGAPEQLLDPEAQPPDPDTRTAAVHWRATLAALSRQREEYWALGVLFIGGYLGVAAWLFETPWPLALVLLYAWPPLTIGLLAFCQRLLRSRPTKRTSIDEIERLRWRDWNALPHRIRQLLRGARSAEQEQRLVFERRHSVLKQWLVVLPMSFAPALGAMWLPLGVAALLAPPNAPGWPHLLGSGLLGLVLLALFTLYLVTFAFSEFLARWRDIVAIAVQPRGGKAAADCSHRQ